MFEKVVGFLQEIRMEMSKVTWPTREELVNSTGVVIVLSLMFAGVIGFFDRILSFVVNTILGR